MEHSQASDCQAAYIEVVVCVWVLIQCGDDPVYPQSVDQLGPSHVLRAQGHGGQGEDNHSQRGTRSDRVHLLRQDWNAHTGSPARSFTSFRC